MGGEGEKGCTCREWLVVCGAFYVVWKLIQIAMLIGACRVWEWPAVCAW